MSRITESDSAFAEYYADLPVDTEHAFSGTRCIFCDVHEDDETDRPCHFHTYGYGTRTNVCECGYVLPI